MIHSQRFLMCRAGKRELLVEIWMGVRMRMEMRIGMIVMLTRDCWGGRRHGAIDDGHDSG